MRYLRLDLKDEAQYVRLRETLDRLAQDWPGEPHHVFCLATPPSLFAPVARGLAAAGLAQAGERARIVVEKPIGHDLRSFHEINNALTESFSEPQIFRIDHFLGKETVQNILALRFASPIFEPIGIVGMSITWW